MKLTPIATSGAGKTGISEEGRSASAERVARAKAVLAGGTASVTPVESTPAPDAQAERAAQSIKRFKMRTNATPAGREYAPSVENVTPAPAETAESTVPDPSETTAAAPEVTKPLSPQFAALAKKERALQVKEREITAREQALLSTKETGTPAPELIARLKSDPLSVLDEHGITYDQLTEALLARQSGDYSAQQLKAELKAEIQALKEGTEKSQTERDQAAEAQVLTQMGKDADALIADPADPYEMVRVTGSKAKVIDLIKRTFHEKGEVLDVTEALELVENQILEDILKTTQAKKIQTKLAPAAQPPAASKPQAQPLRTLTNRDGATTKLSRRDRMIAAFNGTLR